MGKTQKVNKNSHEKQMTIEKMKTHFVFYFDRDLGWRIF